jgi:hypothetical protein
LACVQYGILCKASMHLPVGYWYSICSRRLRCVARHVLPFMCCHPGCIHGLPDWNGLRSSRAAAGLRLIDRPAYNPLFRACDAWGNASGDLAGQTIPGRVPCPTAEGHQLFTKFFLVMMSMMLATSRAPHAALHMPACDLIVTLWVMKTYL